MEKETHFWTCVTYYNKKSKKWKEKQNSLVIMTFAIWTVWAQVLKSTEGSLKNTSTHEHKTVPIITSIWILTSEKVEGRLLTKAANDRLFFRK